MTINEDQKKTFRAIIILNEMINNNHQFSTTAYGDDNLVEPIIIDLAGKGYVDAGGDYYTVTRKGQDVFDVFMKRYTEYLKIYDIFAFVDLDKAEFAFARYFDFDTDEDWDNFKSDPRFEDLRIAVAMFKKLDPAEIVFMAFINENRFDAGYKGWQADLMGNAAFSEIEEIVSTAITPENLGNDAMEDMINQGSAILRDLLTAEEDRRRDNQNGSTYTEEIIEEETVAYYQPYYYDPYYVSPFWLVPLFIW